ncbi:MAG: hypothetical protein AAGA30_13380 [Planctomycetota bacterium]
MTILLASPIFLRLGSDFPASQQRQNANNNNNVVLNHSNTATNWCSVMTRILLLMILHIFLPASYSFAQNFGVLTFDGELESVNIVGSADTQPLFQIGTPITGFIIYDVDAAVWIISESDVSYPSGVVYLEFTVEGVTMRSNHGGTIFINNNALDNNEDSLRFSNLRFDPSSFSSSRNTFINPAINGQIAGNAGFGFNDLSGEALLSVLLEDLINAGEFQSEIFNVNFQIPEFGTQGTYTFNLNQPLFVPALLGDVNLDGVVDLLDVAPFVELIGNGNYQFEADVNQVG